jgi:hypothetical protein
VGDALASQNGFPPSLNFSLRFATLEFATSTPKALQFKNPVLKRHNTW